MAKTLRNKKINQIIYLSLGGAILAIILFIIIFNSFSSKKNNSNINSQLGQKNSIENYIEQANSSIGKKVNDEQKYEEVQENKDIQVKVNDETQQNQEVEIKENDENTNINHGDTVSDSAQNSNRKDSAVSTNSTENEQIIRDDFIDVSNQNQTDNLEDVNNEQKDPNFKMPIEGEILKHYGKEKLIYSNTLKEWTTHLGIDIKADKTAVVKSSADGIVKSVKNDPRYGLTVVVEHENGFKSIYSDLLTAEFVVVGENVKQGQTLGTVGNSATFEILDDSHLHFEIWKDGNSVDPEMYIK